MVGLSMNRMGSAKTEFRWLKVKITSTLNLFGITNQLPNGLIPHLHIFVGESLA